MFARNDEPERSEPAAEFDAIACPVCRRSSRAEKVSRVVAQNRGDLWDTKGNSYQFRSELGGLLAEPPPPDVSTWPSTMRAVVVSLALAAIVFSAQRLASDQVDLPSFIQMAFMATLICLGLLLPLRLIIGTFLGQKAGEERLLQWNEAKARWRRAYYCFRDDVVYLPGEDEHWVPNELGKLIQQNQTTATGALGRVAKSP